MNLCDWKACPYPHMQHHHECRYHSTFFNYPVSLTGRHVSVRDLYDSERPNESLLYVTRPGELNSDRTIYTVRSNCSFRECDPFTDRGWAQSVAKARAILRIEEQRKSAEGKLKAIQRTRRSLGRPNGLTAATVVMPDGAIVRTIAPLAQEMRQRRTGESMAAITGSLAPGTPAANHNEKGGFVLWKGFGKRKVRKSQRMRPQGWHGNHPDQKPRDRWGKREALSDIPIWTPPARFQERRAASGDASSEELEDLRDVAIESLAGDDFGFSECPVRS